MNTAIAQMALKVLLAQRRELMRLQDEGRLTHTVLQQVEVELDHAEMALNRLDRYDGKPA